MLKHWIFDWSGTLVDDMGLVICATNHVLRQYDVEELDREGFRKAFRLPYEEFYDEFVPGVDLEEIEAHFRHGFDISKEKVTVLPHAREFLDFLKTKGCKLYILSSMCAKAFAEQVVELELDGYFEQTYAGVHDKRKVITEMMQTHGMGNQNTVFVGDMVHDIETAHHAGVSSIGVLTGYDRREVLVDAKPEILVDDLSKLMLLSGTSGEKHPSIVRIKGLEVPTFIGVPDEERAEQQTVKVNVEMEPIVDFWKLNDEIELGVDYYQVSQDIKKLALEEPRKLIETLADDIASMIVSYYMVWRVTVSIEKFILPDTEYVGVEVTRGG